METEQDGITYTLFENNAFEESFSADVFHCASEKEGDIVIPSQVIYEGNRYNVRKISHSAFYGNKDITSIFIPDGVKVIEDNAFEACTELAHIVIPRSVKKGWCRYIMRYEMVERTGGRYSLCRQYIVRLEG